MKLELRLYGKSETGKKCIMDTVIYAHDEETMKATLVTAAKEGPWFYYHSTNYALEKITVEHVRRIIDEKVVNPLENW
jgi:hypothetical protein